MPQLDNYLVTLGLKGQNVVLSVMDKIQKKGKDLTKKKTTVPLAVKTKGGKTAPLAVKTKGGKTAPEKTPPDKKSLPGKSERQAKPGVPREKSSPEKDPPDDGTRKFTNSVKKFGRHTDRFANAASSLSPSSLIQAIASTLPYLGAAAAAAGGALESAKSSTAGAYELSKRNSAVAHYGGNLIGGRSSLGRGFLSNSEHALFVSAVSSSMGKIDKTLADALNKLINEKDTRALARAAAGDWESTGTDKGWMASQIMSGTEGLPPSIRQKLSAAMLKNFGSEIQDATPEQKTRQERAAYYENAQETQITRLADTAASAQFENAAGKMVNSMMALNDALNDMQNAMVEGAGKLVTAISFITDAVSSSNNSQRGRTLQRAVEIFK